MKANVKRRIDKTEKKTSPLTIRLRPSVRALAAKRAADQDRSLASYISQLIVADAEKQNND